MGYEDELRGAMSYVFGSSIVCDSLQIAKEVSMYMRVLFFLWLLQNVSFGGVVKL